MDDPASHLSFRPLTILSFRAQRALVGLHGPSFHAVNVLLHALATLGFAQCCRSLLRQRSRRAVAALLFAVHAVHCESVTNTARRAGLQPSASSSSSSSSSSSPSLDRLLTACKPHLAT